MGRRPNRYITKDEKLVRRVVLATFRSEGKPSFVSRRQVAQEVGISVSAVGACLSKGFEDNKWDAVVNVERQSADVVRLPGLVKDRYGLDDCLLVPAADLLVDDLPPEERRRGYREVLYALAPRVGEFLDAIIQQARGEPLVIAVAGGVTVRLIAGHLAETARPVGSDAVEFVTACGWLGTSHEDGVEPATNVQVFARAYRGRSRYLPAVGFPMRDETALATQSKGVRSILRKLRSAARVVVTGLSHIPTDPTEAKIANDPTVNAAVIDSARRAGAIGAICHLPFDAQGRFACPSYGVVGLTLEDLRGIAAEEGRHVVVVVGGDRRRWSALKAALERKLASVLVTDTETARFLMGEVVM